MIRKMQVIQELMVYEFELGHNTTEATKLDHNTAEATRLNHNTAEVTKL